MEVKNIEGSDTDILVRSFKNSYESISTLSCENDECSFSLISMTSDTGIELDVNRLNVVIQEFSNSLYFRNNQHSLLNNNNYEFFNSLTKSTKKKVLEYEWEKPNRNALA